MRGGQDFGTILPNVCVRESASIRPESMSMSYLSPRQEGHLVRENECEQKKAKDRAHEGKMVRRRAMKALGNEMKGEVKRRCGTER